MIEEIAKIKETIKKMPDFETKPVSEIETKVIDMINDMGMKCFLMSADDVSFLELKDSKYSVSLGLSESDNKGKRGRLLIVYKHQNQK